MTILPVHNTLLIPETTVFFQTEYYRGMTGRNPQVEEELTIIVMRDLLRKEELKADSFFPIGIKGTITEVNNNGFILVRTGTRLNIEEVYIFKDGNIDLAVSPIEDINDENEKSHAARVKDIKAAFAQYAETMQWGVALRGYMADWDSIARIASALSPWFINSNEERYAVLEENSIKKRNKKLESIIYENLELLKVNSEAKNAQKEDYEKMYRESALKKQISYLQNELEEMHPENVSEVREFEKKIETLPMNDLAKKECTKILRRLKQEGNHSSEYAMLYDYMDFVTSLPWKKEKPKAIRLEAAGKVLDKEHYGLKKIKKRIIEQIAVMSLKGSQSGSILCFVGAPGTGKTSIGASVAEALKRKYIRVSLGGVRDEADIRGHRRTYIGAMPGRIMDGISKAGVSNPVMVLDEVDKLSSSYNGDPSAALLEVLDPEQNKNFTDHYMNVPFDLSDVLFICTANTLDTIPEPLLNRMEVMRFDGYTPIEKENIAAKHLIPKAVEAAGIKKNSLKITPEAIHMVISEYTRESGVRGLKKKIDNICRQAAVNIITKREEKNLKRDPVQTITADNLKDYIEDKPLFDRRVRAKTQPGVVTGLAWTSVGGDILYIETMFTKGAGETVITGQLGDVMKESARIAVTLVRSMYPESVKLFKDNTLHIHVPDGATPKDGPSAGITLVTALSSLVTGKPVPPNFAMTGEVSLQGDVNPIGGLLEKLLAAQRSGVKKVFIPRDNVRDLEDIPSEVKDALKIIPVKKISEVIKKLGLEGKSGAK